MANDKLAELRAQIDAANAELLRQLNRRLQLTDAIWKTKAEAGLPARVPDREASMLASLTSANKGPMSDAEVRRVFCLLFRIAVHHMEPEASEAASPREARDDQV